MRKLFACLAFTFALALIGRAADWAYLDNGTVRLGVRQDVGACIAWLSRSGSERNLLNGYDAGRFVQQSYYGDADGSMWAEKPWRWNPVQGGSYKDAPATVVTFEATPTRLYSKTTPKHWATGADLPEVAMEQWIELAGKTAKVRFKMTYSGTVAHAARHQELPAIFFNSDLTRLVFYKGGSPWTRAVLTTKTPGAKNEYDDIAEHWAAWVDERGQGAGFYNAHTTQMTSYRVELPNAPRAAECSYFAPIQTFAIMPGLVFEYEVHLIVGSIEEIREAAYRLHSQAKPHSP